MILIRSWKESYPLQKLVKNKRTVTLIYATHYSFLILLVLLLLLLPSPCFSFFCWTRNSNLVLSASVGARTSCSPHAIAIHFHHSFRAACRSIPRSAFWKRSAHRSDPRSRSPKACPCRNCFFPRAMTVRTWRLREAQSWPRWRRMKHSKSIIPTRLSFRIVLSRWNTAGLSEEILMTNKVHDWAQDSSTTKEQDCH